MGSRRLGRTVSLVAATMIAAAAVWTILTVVIAVTQGKGHGTTFWAAIGLLSLIALLLVYVGWRLVDRLRGP
jgi:hypothetical protein